MKALIASLAALGLITSPALAQTNTAAAAKTAKTAKAPKSVVKEAKAEHESVATEMKEHKAAAKHHAKKHHARKHAAKKMAKKTTTKTSTEKKTS
jgi:hypothetical protein